MEPEKKRKSKVTILSVEEVTQESIDAELWEVKEENNGRK